MFSQKKKEKIVLQQFLKLLKLEYDSLKINTQCKEPSDIEYNNQGYQITTGGGSRFGEILSSTKRYNILNVDNRVISGKPMKINDFLDRNLKPILIKKSQRSCSNVVLLISLHLPDPFKEDDRELMYMNFANNNLKLLSCWQSVYCIYMNKKLIRLY